MTNTHPGKPGEREPLLGHNNNHTYSPGQGQEAHTHHGRLDNYFSEGLSDQVSPPTDNEAIRLAALQALPWYRRPSLYWLLPLVFMAAIVLGVSSGPQEQLTIKIICKNHFRNSDAPFDEDICKAPAVQAAGALALSRIRGLKYTSAVFTVGYITSQSDRIGRKSLIYLTLIPVMAEDCFSILASILMSVTDCTPREGRSLALGYVMVALAVGLIVGPILGGTLIELTGNLGTALEISLVTMTLLCIYTVILPESLPKRTTEELSTKIGGEMSFWEKFKTFIKSVLDPMLLFLPGRIDASSDVNVTPSKYTLLLLVAAYGCLQFAGNGLLTIFIPYTAIYKRVFYKGSAQDAHPDEEHLLREKRRQGAATDLTFFIFGCSIYVIAYLIVPRFEVEPIIFILSAPSFTSLLTSHVPIHQTGTALGGVCVMDTIIMSVSSLLFGWVFSKTATTMPSAIFLVSGSMAFIAVLIALYIWASYRRAK
ncbi:hypothetical protein BGZ52_002847 [Haplosporangium bisporale]|nr:hypothetical protein BGZ52_002847 [Haplosporangium bisporale]